jgi:hypothetical protein
MRREGGGNSTVQQKSGETSGGGAKTNRPEGRRARECKSGRGFLESPLRGTGKEGGREAGCVFGVASKERVVKIEIV